MKTPPEPKTVEEALALVTGGPDDYCDPKDQPEPERGTALDIRAEDLVMLLRRAVVRFRAIDDHKGNVLADSIMDYLRRKGLADGTSILREAPSPLPVREQSAWISVRDRLPEHGQYVLTVGGEILRIAHPARVVCDKEGKIEFWWALKQRNPTHWMPMIEPPAIAGEKEE